MSVRNSLVNLVLVLVTGLLAHGAALADEAATPAAAADAAAAPAAAPQAQPAVATEPAVPTAQVQDPKPAARYGEEGLGFMFRLSYEGGGDAVVKAVYTDGTSDTLTAGEGFGFALGAHYRPVGSRVDLAALVGMKIGQISGSNASIDVTRTTFELRGDVNISQNIWVGVGQVFHRGIKADLDGFGPNFALEDATGTALRLGWGVFAITHTTMDYEDEFGFDYDATATGIELVARL